jgi:hypothetical protein
MDRNQLMQAVCNDLRPNAIDPQNPYVPVDSVMPAIAQLTAENERLTRVVEQAILVAGLEVTGDLVSSNRYGTHFSPPVPDLYAQLKEVDRG